MASTFRLLRDSGLVRRQLVVFALLTAAFNGIVTASVGAWLAQTYSSHQSRRQSVQNIADLIYERRTRAGMVVSSLRRGADADELRYRKRAYDEAFVEWNKKIQNNVLQIREVMGAVETTKFETLMQDQLVPAMITMDICVTKAYDLKLAGQDPLAFIKGCRYAELNQFTLDCAAGFTDELYRVTRLTFLPLLDWNRRELEAARKRATEACTRPAILLAPVPPPPKPAAANAPAASAGQQGQTPAELFIRHAEIMARTSSRTASSEAGLARHFTPAANRLLARSSPPAYPDISNILRPGLAFSAFVASVMPSMPGISTSETSKSTAEGSAISWASADCPSSNSITSWPSLLSARASSVRADVSSSASRMRAIRSPGDSRNSTAPKSSRYS